MRSVVTGGGGFVGQWLARSMIARGDDVWLSGLGERPATPEILTRAEWNAVHWQPADVRSASDIEALLGAAKPDLIVHLAGISFIPDAEQAPQVASDVNVGGAQRLLAATQALRASGAVDPTVLIVGSGTQYGAHQLSEMPLTESAAQQPIGVYAASKARQEALALEAARSTGMRVICTRSFSHSGVGHDPVFLLPSLVRRANEIRRQGGTLAIGNDVRRDYLHVADVVSAYLGLAHAGRSGEAYNVASGIGVTVRGLAELVMRHAGIEAEIVSDPKYQRPSDVPVLIGSPAKLAAETGWRPEKTCEDIVDDLLAASG